MFNSLRPHGLDTLWNSLGQTTGVGSLFLLQGIFSTQGLHPGLPHCRQILYQLSQQGSASSPIIRLIIREYSRSREKSMKSSLDKVLVASRLWGKFTATSFSPSCKLHTEHCFSQKSQKVKSVKSSVSWQTSKNRTRRKTYLCASKLFYQRRRWHPTPALLPGKSHGWRSLVDCSPRDCTESDTTEAP